MGVGNEKMIGHITKSKNKNKCVDFKKKKECMIDYVSPPT